MKISSITGGYQKKFEETEFKIKTEKNFVQITSVGLQNYKYQKSNWQRSYLVTTSYINDIVQRIY